MVISGRIRTLNNVLAETLRLNVYLRFRLVSIFEDKSSKLMLLLLLVALFAFQTKAQNPPPPAPPLTPARGRSRSTTCASDSTVYRETVGNPRGQNRALSRSSAGADTHFV